VLSRQQLAGWLGFAGVVLFALVGIGGPLVGHGVFSAAEQLRFTSPWVFELNTQPTPGESPLSDTYQQYQPSIHETVVRLRHGDLAWTSPYEHGDTMLAGWVGDGLADPMNLPWLVLPVRLAPGYTKLLEILVAAGFMYLFCRRIGLSRAAGWVGGVAYAASGFQIAWTNWPQSRVGAVSAVLLWATERFVQRRTAGSVALLAAVVAWHFGAGFPSVTLLTLLFVGCYASLRIIQLSDRDVRQLIARFAAFAAAVALGIGVMAVQLIGLDHVLAASDISNREGFLGAHSRLRELVTSVLPTGLGLPETGGQLQWSNIVEIQAFVGVAALVMILGVVVRRRADEEQAGIAPFFVVAAALTVIVIFHGGLALRILQLVPRLGENSIGRMRSVLGLECAVLVALGANRWATSSTIRLHRRAWWWGGAAALVAGSMLFTVWAVRPVQDANLHSLHRGALVAALSAAAAIGVLVVVRCRPRLGIGMIAPVMALEALMFVLPYWHRSSDELFYPGSPLLADAGALVGPDRMEAIGAIGHGANSWYGLRTATGYSPAATQWAELLDGVNPTLARSTWGTQIDTVDQAVAAAPLLDRLAVRYVLVGHQSLPDPLPASWTLVDQSVGGVLMERPTALPRIRWASTSTVIAPGAQVAALATGVAPSAVVLDAPSGAAEGGSGEVRRADEQDNDHRAYDVHADGAGYLVIADSFDTWWRATVVGHDVPILRADHAMMAVAVGPGDHVVRFDYRVPRTGIATSAVLALVVVMLAGWALLSSQSRARVLGRVRARGSALGRRFRRS